MNNSRQFAVGSKQGKTKILFAYCLLSTAYCLLLCGCGGPSAPTLSSVHTKAIEYNRNGMKAMEKGDYEKALNYYMEALKINQSIEHTEGIAINLINIAVVYQKKGKTSEAHKFIDTVLSIQDINDDIRSEAAFEKARLYLKDKELSMAEEWVNRSLSFNKGIREGSRLNLLVRIALIEGKHDEALSIANAALGLNRENKQRAEEANSLRLIAEINVYKGHYEESREFYMKALEIDKELGDSKKITMDLGGLGRLSLKQENSEDALNFYRRAYNVGLNAGDIEETLQILESISDIYRKIGDEKKAKEIESQREEILKRK